MDKIITKRIVNRKFWLLVLTMSGLLLEFLPFIEQTIHANLIEKGCKQYKFSLNLYDMISLNFKSIYYPTKINIELLVSFIIEISLPIVILVQILSINLKKKTITFYLTTYVIIILSNMYFHVFDKLMYGFYLLFMQQLVLLSVFAFLIRKFYTNKATNT